MDGQRGKDVSLTSCKVCVVTSRPPGLILEPKERDVQWIPAISVWTLLHKQGSASAYFRRRRFIHPGQWMEVKRRREGGKKERDGGGREGILLMTELISRLIK